MRNNKIKIFLIAALFIFSSFFTSITIGEQRADLEYKKSIHFDENDLISISIKTKSYEIISSDIEDYISTEDFGRLLIPGKPNLPSKIFSIAIPPEAKLVDIEYDLGNAITLPNEYKISPSPLPRVLGYENPEIYEQEKQKYNENYESTYLTNEPYPSSNVEFLRTSGYRKYNLIDVRVTPFSYKPISETLIYYPEIKIDIQYEISNPYSAENTIIDNVPKFEKNAEQFIYNYDQAQNWYPSGTTNTQNENYNYVIITLDSLETSVESIKDWEITKGNNVNVVTSSWISANYEGFDLAEKIRNFLREKYPSEEWGIENVLLVGHYDEIPMRRTAQDVGYGEPETDFYYAELSKSDADSWDDDSDHLYGENGDQIDFYNEIIVGRIPWSNPSIVSDICEKSVLYEQNNDTSYKKNILLLGAYFWDDTDNAVLMEKKVDQPWMSDWTMTRMYEQGHSNYAMDYDLKNTNVVSVWSNNKFGFVNWAGHGSPTASYILYSTGESFIKSADTSIISNDYPSIVFADACSNSDTDQVSIGQSMINQGAVGFVGATKVAFGQGGWNHPYDGSGQSLDYFFTTYVTSGNYTQGEAHQLALREMYLNGLWYYNKYETFEWGALFGNPNLGMGEIFPSNPPEILNIEISPDIQETNNWINISCDIIAQYEVNSVNVHITYPDSSSINPSMINIIGTDTYYYNSTYPHSGNYNLYISSIDTNDDSSVSNTYDFNIGIPPEIDTIETSKIIQSQNGFVNISCIASDNELVNSVYVNITDPNDNINSYQMIKANSKSTDTYYYNTSYNLNGTYKYHIIAEDNHGNKILSENNYYYIGEGATPIYFIDSGSGWNMITIPVENTYTANSLALQIEGCKIVSRFNANLQSYESFIVGVSPPSADFTIDNGIGYFVVVDENSIYFANGNPIQNVNVPLSSNGSGWNMIGWYEEFDIKASHLAENVTSCTIVSIFDANLQTYKSYIVGVSPPGADFTITPGMGVFVVVDDSSIWIG